jgi:hypothetical protein
MPGRGVLTRSLAFALFVFGLSGIGRRGVDGTDVAAESKVFP